MKNVNIKYFYYFLFSVGVCFFSCGKKDNNNNPIIVKKPFKASFTIYEPFYGTDRKFSTDTIVSHRATFSTDAFYDSCKWILGDDPRIWTASSLTLNFPNTLFGQTIPITLIAFKKGETDTVIKKITVMGLKGTTDEVGAPAFVINPNYLGKFIGSFQDVPSHQFEVNVVNFGTTPFPTGGAFFWEFRVFNLPEGCGGPFYNADPLCVVKDISPYQYAYEFYCTYKAFYVNSGDEIGCCPPVMLYGYMDSINPKKIIIEYSQFKSRENRQVISERKFIGYKQ